MDEPEEQEPLLPPWLQDVTSESARKSLLWRLECFDVTNWGEITDMACIVMSAAGVDDPTLSVDKTRELYEIGRSVLDYNWELPEHFRPFVSILLENYGTDKASEGEKFVQYHVEEAINNMPIEQRVHLRLFFGKPPASQS